MKKKIKKVGPKILIGSIAFVSPTVFIGGAIGYLSAMYFAGREGHNQIIKSIIFDIGNYRIQLHHWLLFPVFLILAAFFNFFLFSSLFFFGFLGGLAFQDIHLDRDWKKVLRKK
jgi:hypothetical protein